MPGPRSLPGVGMPGTRFLLGVGISRAGIPACPPGTTPPQPVLTSCVGHRSEWYASYWIAFLLPSANKVAERLSFYTCLSFCPQGRGVSTPVHAGIHTPLGRHPPPPADGYCCGRYASYWNAFLLCLIVHIKFNDMSFPFIVILG